MSDFRFPILWGWSEPPNPKQNLLGEENKGWTYAKYLLTHERTGIAGVPNSKSAINHLKVIANKTFKNGKPLIQDPLFSSQIAELEIDLKAMEIFNLPVVTYSYFLAFICVYLSF